jgi:hypothetical protein
MLAIATAKIIIDTLTNVKTLLNLVAVISLLEWLKRSVVCAQDSNVYVCNLAKALWDYYRDIYDLYWPKMAFRNEVFPDINSLYNLTRKNMKMWWQPNLNDYEEHLIY